MYDAIIVGARCAGSPLAMLLARQGHKVLLVDRSTFPSDIMSTHFLQQDATVRLQKWGLLDRVAATNCPRIPKVTFHVNGAAFEAPRDPNMPLDYTYCPRRTVLDKILVDAAVEAGAELRDGFSVQEIRSDGDRVTGISGRNAGGESVTEDARVVVGADGIHSMVAKAVDAEEYNTRPAYTCGYYAYYSGVPLDGAELYLGDKSGVLAFPTNDGLSCVAAMRPRDQFQAFRSDIEGNFLDTLKGAAPSVHERVLKGKREEKFIGTAETQNYFRKPYGPGWALVGDAGYHRDPVTGLGIMDAFRDADLLAEALHRGWSDDAPMDDALAEYQRQRDAAAMPMYEFTLQLAQFQAPGVPAA